MERPLISYPQMFMDEYKTTKMHCSYVKNNFSEIIKSGLNVLPYHAKISNSRLIKHKEIEHNI